MSFAPYAVLWVALVVVSALLLPASRRHRSGLVLSFGMPIAALMAGLFLRPDAEAPAWSFAGRQWASTGTAYGLTGVLLLLLPAGVARRYLGPVSDGGHEENEPALLFALTAASLPALWAADDRSRVLGLALFAVVWAASAYLLRMNEADASPAWATPAARAAGAVFCLWAAAALPAWSTPLRLLASAVLLGVWPFVPRPGSNGATPLGLVGDGVAVALGAAVAASTLRFDAPSGALVAAATAVGLLSMLIGLSWAWQPAPERTASALRPALGGLALAAAVWLGSAALVSAARLAIFAPAALMLAAGIGARERANLPEAGAPARRRFSPHLVAVVVVVMAVAGLPLTVGFDIFPRLYGAWLDAGGWILLLLAVLLLSFWTVAIIQSGRKAARGEAADRAAWLRSAALLLPLLGLVSVRRPTADVAPLVWIALAVPLIVGLISARFVPASDNVGGLLREAIAPPEPARRLAALVERAGQTARDALADALAILEGEYGLLWLLGILLLLLWVA